MSAIALLMLLLLKVRLHPALAILLSSIALGVLTGMPLRQIPNSITGGVGSLLGRVALVLGLGAVLGHLLASSGGAAAVGEGLVDRVGARGLPIAMMFMGLLVGMPVFFEVGLVLLMPIIVSVAKRSEKSPIVTGLPTLAGLSIVHGLIPPHPAAMLAVAQYHADVGKTILLGVAAGVPAALLAGPGYAWFYSKASLRSRGLGPINLTPQAQGPARFAESLAGELIVDPSSNGSRPRHLIAVSILILLLPVVLIFAGSWADWLVSPSGSFGWLNAAMHLVGDPQGALLVAVLMAIFCLKKVVGWNLQEMRKLTGESFAPIAGVMMILAAAGGLSRVLSDSGASTAVVDIALAANLSPLLLGWMLAATVRLAIGSATVAMAVTTGILAPLATAMHSTSAGVHFGPELLVLATGAGSLFCSHVNDPGFWMIKEFFGMELTETMATWSVLETILSVSGLLGTLILSWWLV